MAANTRSLRLAVPAEAFTQLEFLAKATGESVAAMARFALGLGLAALTDEQALNAIHTAASDPPSTKDVPSPDATDEGNEKNTNN